MVQKASRIHLFYFFSCRGFGDWVLCKREGCSGTFFRHGTHLCRWWCGFFHHVLNYYYLLVISNIRLHSDLIPLWMIADFRFDSFGSISPYVTSHLPHSHRFIKGFMNRNQPVSVDNSEYLAFVRQSYLTRLKENLPVSLLDRGWPSPPPIMQQVQPSHTVNLMNNQTTKMEWTTDKSWIQRLQYN